MSKKSACGGLFRQKLKKCLRPGAQTPRPPGTGGKRQPCGLLPPKAAKRPEGAPEGSVCPVARREACALWALGPKAQSDPKRGSETMSATVREARMIEQPGHLPPKVAKRPEGVSKYKGCARPARRTPIFARERNERWARSAPSAKIERPGKAGRYEFTLEGTEGSVSPVGCCHRRWQSDPKESTETSGGRGQRPSRRLRLRTCGSSKPPQMGYLTA